MMTSLSFRRSQEQGTSLLKTPDFSSQVTTPENVDDTVPLPTVNDTDHHPATDAQPEASSSLGGDPGTEDTEPTSRRSTRQGAGQHSNPHNLPRSAVLQDMSTMTLDPQILNSIAQSNLLILQMMAKTSSG